MKFIIPALLFSTSVLADCLCTNDLFNRDKAVASVDACKSLIVEELYAAYEDQVLCQTDASIEVNWSCGTTPQNKKFDCSLFGDMKAAKNNLLLTTSLDTTLKKDFSPAVICEDEGIKGLKLSFKDKKDLVTSLEEMGLKGSEVFDKVDNGSFTMILTNDNWITDMGKGGKSNDRGNTHSMLMKFDKNIGKEGYILSLSYESNLFTQFTNPEKPDYKRDAQNITHVSQNFIEENVAKLVLAKAKKGDAYYWEAGGGIHQLNKDDINNPVLFSGLRQQEAFHDAFISYQRKKTPDQRVVTKIYDNIPQSGSETGLMLEGAIGKRLTLDPLSGKRIRTYLDGSVTGRATTVHNASYAGLESSLNTDIRIFNETGLRITAGNRARVYVNSDTTSENFVNVAVANRKFETGVTYTDPSKKLAFYQNPLPRDMARREELAPGRNKFYQVYFKVKW